jgi:hypothetical protein
MRKHFKRILLAGAALLAVAGFAKAEDFHQSLPIYLVCTASDGYRVWVAVKDDGWHVGFELRPSGHAFRQKQYWMSAGTVGPDGQMGWSGTYRPDPQVRMVGKLFHDANDQSHFTYQETQWRPGGQVLVTKNNCYRVTDYVSMTPWTSAPYRVAAAPAPEFPPSHRPATPAPGASDYSRNSVAISYDRGAAWVQVGMGSGSLRMLLDTGASSSSLPFDVADELVKAGQAHIIGKAHFTMADGHEQEEYVIVIDRVSIGSHVISNIKASVSPNGAATTNSYKHTAYPLPSVSVRNLKGGLLGTTQFFPNSRRPASPSDPATEPEGAGSAGGPILPVIAPPGP